MSDDIKSEVEIRPDFGSASLGKNAYFAARDGEFSARGLKSSVLVMLGLVASIFFAMQFSKKMDHNERPGRAIPAPGLSRDDSGINPKLLTERDLINVIKPQRKMDSSLGRIRIVSLRSITELPIGSEMHAVLESGATDGIVKARLTSPLIVDGEPILPERTVLFGRGKSGDERLFIEFSKVIFPTGETYTVRAQAFDVSDKIQGLKGAVVGTRSKKMAGAVAFGFLGGMADGLQETNGSIFMARKPSVRDGALSGASKAALDQSQLYMEDLKKSPNIVEVKAGTAIIVLTDEPKQKREGMYDEK